MNDVLYIHENDYLNKDEFNIFKECNEPLNKADVATIIDIFCKINDTNIINNIKCILKNSDGYFIYLIGNSESNFDLLEYLNINYSGIENITPTNVLLLFPKSLSRGYYSFDTINNQDSEKTGFLDEEILNTTILSSKVVFLKNVRTERMVQIVDSGISIGRSVDADYVLDNNSNVSRIHCKVYLKNGLPFIIDKGSTNGTFVNGNKLKSETETMLSTGDTVYVATEEFKIV